MNIIPLKTQLYFSIKDDYKTKKYFPNVSKNIIENSLEFNILNGNIKPKMCDECDNIKLFTLSIDHDILCFECFGLDLIGEVEYDFMFISKKLRLYHKGYVIDFNFKFNARPLLETWNTTLLEVFKLLAKSKNLHIKEHFTGLLKKYDDIINY